MPRIRVALARGDPDWLNGQDLRRKDRMMDCLTRFSTRHHVARFVQLSLGAALGLVAVFLLLSALTYAAPNAEIDLMVRAEARTYADIGSTYVVNVSFANKGTASAPDNKLTVTLPDGTEFVDSTYIGGHPRPPDQIDGNELSWTLAPLVADSTWSHILITLQVDDSLSEGDRLTVEAEISTSAPEPDTKNNTASVTTTVNFMGGSFKRVHARYGMPADVLDYTITINFSQQPGGGANGRWVTLTDTLPFSHQARFLGWRGTVTGSLIEGHKLRWEGQVRAGEPVTLQYRLGVEGTITPGAMISNAAQLRWAGHEMQLGPATTEIIIPQGVLGVGPDQGGQVYHSYGVTLTVPRGAVTDTTRFQLGPLFTATHPISPPGGLLFAHRAFEANAFRFGEPVGQFNAPLTITMTYSDGDVAGLKRETLRLWTREGPEGPWNEAIEPARVM